MKKKQVKQKFNNIAYQKELDMLLQYTYSEYKNITLERQNIQLGLVKNYLWLSTVILGVYFSVWMAFLSKIDILSLSSLSMWHCVGMFLAILANISAIIVLILGIDALRGREHNTLPFGDFNTLVKESYNAALKGKKFSSHLYISLITKITEVIKKRTMFVDFIGHRLRVMSKLLLFSICTSVVLFLLVTFILFVEKNNNYRVSPKFKINIECSITQGEKNE